MQCRKGLRYKEEGNGAEYPPALWGDCDIFSWVAQNADRQEECESVGQEGNGGGGVLETLTLSWMVLGEES